MSRSFHCINSEINPASGIVTKRSRITNITSKSYFVKKNEQKYEKANNHVLNFSRLAVQMNKNLNA